MEKYTEIKTFQDACKVLMLDYNKVIPDFSCYPEKDRTSMIAHAKLIIITRAANKLANSGKEWVPDFTNYKEPKYEAWFDLSGGSSGFRFNVYDLWATNSDVGSRLCFISSEVCKYVANQFIGLYKEYFL